MTGGRHVSDGPAARVFAARAHLAEPLSRATKLRVIATVHAFVLLLTGFEVGVRVVPPDAMQVWAVDPVSGHTLAVASVTEGRSVAHLYALINSMHSESAFGKTCSGGLPGPVTFDVVFIRWSLPVEDATQIAAGCGWEVSQGGIPSFCTDTAGQTQAILSELRSLLPAVPSPWPTVAQAPTLSARAALRARLAMPPQKVVLGSQQAVVV
jgi:hypothetical protein